MSKMAHAYINEVVSRLAFGRMERPL